MTAKHRRSTERNMTAKHNCALGVCLLVSAAQLACQHTAGRVVDVLGAPIPAAMVEVVVAGETVRKTYADGEGIYLLPQLPEFGASLRISKEGMAAIELPKQGPRTRAVRNVTLLDAGKLHGTIRDEHGQPVAGIAVIAVYGKDSLHTRTDKDGTYVLEPVPLGKLSLNVWAGECAVQQDVRLRSAGTYDVQLPKRNTTPRQVRVQGLPAAMKGACVEVINANLALMPRNGRVPLNADGTAVVLVNEMTVIKPKVPGFVTSPLGRLAVTGTSDLEFTAKMHDADARRTELTGKVRTGRGTPAPGQPLLFCDQSGTLLGTTTVDRSGNFKIRLARPRLSRIRIGMPLDCWELIDEERSLRDGFAWVPVYAGDDVIELRVEETGTLETAIRDATGTLLALADVTVADPVSSHRAIFRGASDRSGKLRIALPVDDYQLLAVTPDGRVCIGDAHLRAGQTVDVKWRTVATGAVTGVVVDGNGKPLPGVELYVAATEISNEHEVYAAARQSARIHTDHRGHFRCRGLPPGDWTVVATGDPSFDTVEFTVRANQEFSLKMQPR